MALGGEVLRSQGIGGEVEELAALERRAVELEGKAAAVVADAERERRVAAGCRETHPVLAGAAGPGRAQVAGGPSSASDRRRATAQMAQPTSSATTVPTSCTISSINANESPSQRVRP